MGNLVGVVEWKKTPYDGIHIDNLENIRKKYRLEYTDDSILLPMCDKDNNQYGVHLGGIILSWYGRQNIINEIKSFLYDVDEYFKKNKIVAKTEFTDLPL